MNRTEVLKRVRIASPCLASWNDMRGDNRSRFCDQCGKHVFNFSEMTSQEVLDLIEEKEGALCGRLYRRRDGMLLTSDCPMGAVRLRKRIRTFSIAVATIGILAIGSTLSASFGRSSRPDASKVRDRAVEMTEHVIWQVKEWLGLNPVYTAGIVCIPTVDPASEESEDVTTTE